MATRKAAAKKVSSNVAAEKAPARKTATKRTSAKTSASESNAKRSPSKAPAEKAPAKSAAGRKYSPDASQSVEREMNAMHEGKLTLGNTGKKVTDPKQAIAIGLSEARRAGAKVPPPPRK